MRGWRAQAHASSSLAFGTILAFLLLAPTSIATTVVVYATSGFVVLGVDGQTQIFDFAAPDPVRLGSGDKFAMLGDRGGIATYQLYAFRAGDRPGPDGEPGPRDYLWERFVADLAGSEDAKLPIPGVASALARRVERAFVGWESVLRSPAWIGQASPPAELVGFFVAGFADGKPYVFHLRLPIDRREGRLLPVELSREYDGGRGFYLTVAGQRQAALAALRQPDSVPGRKLAQAHPETAARLHRRKPRPLDLAHAQGLVRWLLELEAAGGAETGGNLTVATSLRVEPGWTVQRGPAYHEE